MGVDHGVGEVLTPWKYVGGVKVCFDPFDSELLLDKLDNCKSHIINDERLASKMEGKTNFSRPLQAVRKWDWWEKSQNH